MTTAPARRIFVLAHTGRPEVRDAALAVCRSLLHHGMALRLLKDEADQLGLDSDDCELAEPVAEATAGCELMVVVGGDGTILRAAELARDGGTPLLGINLGHVGFLAEAEQDDLELVIAAIATSVDSGPLSSRALSDRPGTYS